MQFNCAVNESAMGKYFKLATKNKDQMEDERSVLENILKIMQDRGLKQAWLAGMMQTSESTISRTLTGKVGLTYWFLARFASAVGCSVVDVITYPLKYDYTNDAVETSVTIKVSGEKKRKILDEILGLKDLSQIVNNR